MNYFNKRKVVILIISVLLAVNIATISTIVYHTYYRPQHKSKYWKERRESFNKFWQDLQLTEGQEKVYKDSYNLFLEKTREVQNKQYLVRVKMMDEMSKPEVDTIKLESLAEQSGELHKELKMIINRHVLRIKGVSNDKQYKMMEKVFRHYIERDNPKEKYKRYRKYRNRGKSDSTRFRKE